VEALNSLATSLLDRTYSFRFRLKLKIMRHLFVF